MKNTPYRTRPPFRALLGMAFLGAMTLSAVSQPNIVLILLDDLGYADLGCQGSPDIRTPNIDALAASGIRFTSGYVPVSVCGPSRASLITGRYAAAFGIQGNSDVDAGIPRRHKTMAEYLKRAGYATQAIGKWHLGSTPDQTPMARGFDVFCGHLGGGSHYFPFSEGGHKWNTSRKHSAIHIQKNDRILGVGDVPPDTYLTDFFTDEAVAFIGQKRAGPFFIYLAYNAPHGPIMAPESLKERNAHIPDVRRRTFAAMMTAVDDGVGRVVDALASHGIRENTLIVLLSDNGGPTRVNTSLNTPFRGQKGDVWEGGVRVPFMMSWPGKIAPGQARDAFICSLDLLPTFLAISGLDVTDTFDGVNLLPWLLDDHIATPRERIYFWRAGGRAVRSGDYKLVIPKANGRGELFHIRENPSEASAHALQMPEMQQNLTRALAEWEAAWPPPFRTPEDDRDTE